MWLCNTFHQSDWSGLSSRVASKGKKELEPIECAIHTTSLLLALSENRHLCLRGLDSLCVGGCLHWTCLDNRRLQKRGGLRVHMVQMSLCAAGLVTMRRYSGLGVALHTFCNGPQSPHTS